MYVGTDLVELKRFKKKITNSSSILKKLFTPAELQNCDPAHLAGIFAAKEAAIKALSLTSGSWLEMEVNYQESGKPILKSSKKIRNKFKDFDLTISHNGNYVVAVFLASVK